MNGPPFKRAHKLHLVLKTPGRVSSDTISSDKVGSNSLDWQSRRTVGGGLNPDRTQTKTVEIGVVDTPPCDLQSTTATLRCGGTPKRQPDLHVDLVIALISTVAGIQMVHVPFAGLGPATNALMAGTIDVGLVTPVQVKPHVESGVLRALAVSSKNRSRVLPNVPTLEETGLPISAVVAYGLTAPARTPPSIVVKLRIAMDELMKDKTFTDRFNELGFEPDPLIGEAYRDFIVKDLEQWRGVAKAAAIKIDN